MRGNNNFFIKTLCRYALKSVFVLFYIVSNDRRNVHVLCSSRLVAFRPVVGDAVQLLLADVRDLLSVSLRFSTVLFSFESSLSLTHFRSYGPTTPVSAFKGIRYRRSGLVSGDTENKKRLSL